MRLTLVIHSLDGGGAEKTMAMMATRWANAGHVVTLVTLDSGENDRYQLASDVRRVGLHQMSESRTKLEGIWRNVSRISQIRSAIMDADGDFVVSFTEKINILVLLACRRIGARVIACERTDPRWHPIGRIWSFLRRRTYRHAHAIVVQTESTRDFVQQFASRVPIHVVPNCIWSDSLDNELTPCVERSKTIVAIGRLVKIKGFDLLIKAFHRIAGAHPEWKLIIVGEGPARSELTVMISELNLSDRVELAGWCVDPTSVLRDAQVFVMSSVYEGFPNALLEAMAMGLAPISFDCESGPREIIRHELDGLLVPSEDVGALADALRRLLSDNDERCRLADRALEVRERFSESAFFDAWDHIFQNDARSEQNA